ncbi:MAG: hypothetical protein WDN49_26825 [Acetobacteraceae bacterium]
MARRWYSWTHLPVAFGAAVLTFGAGLLIANLTLEVVRPGHPIKITPTQLFGMTVQEAPHLSLETVLNGRFQAVYGRDIGSHLPLYAAAVKLRNQIDYSLSGVSDTPSVVVGRYDQLIERGLYRRVLLPRPCPFPAGGGGLGQADSADAGRHGAARQDVPLRHHALEGGAVSGIPAAQHSLPGERRGPDRAGPRLDADPGAERHPHGGHHRRGMGGARPIPVRSLAARRHALERRRLGACEPGRGRRAGGAAA